MVTAARASMMPNWTEGDIDNDGVSIHYARTGDGAKPPVVLAHGFSDSGLCWSRTAIALEPEFDLVMLDGRNHGLSGTGNGDASMLAADVAAAVTGLELDRPAVMGHSIGARTMADFAATHPELVSRLVLEDPPWRRDMTPEADRADRLEGARGYVSSLGELGPEEILEMGRTQHPEWSEEDYPAWVEAKQRLRVESVDSLSLGDWTETVPGIMCPTLLISGEAARGGIVEPGLVEAVIDMNPSVTSVMIAGAGHNIRREQFDRYVEVARAFLLER